MTVRGISTALRDALAVSQMSAWELGRRTGLKTQVIESILQDVSQVSVGVLDQLAAGLDLEVALHPVVHKRQVGDVLSVVDLAVQRVEPGSLVHVASKPWVLALALEGVLIGKEGVVARPGLYRFLTCCRPLAPRIIVFAVVPESRFREVARLLVAEGSAPVWFADVEYAHWSGDGEVSAVVPRADPRFTLLVDGMQQDGGADRQSHRIAVAGYEPPFGLSDGELDHALEQIARRILLPLE